MLATYIMALALRLANYTI